VPVNLNGTYNAMFPHTHRFSTSAFDVEKEFDRVKRMNSYPSITLHHIILPPDIQIFGIIHGGILLKWIEEAGDIVASRFCNRFASGDDWRKNTSGEHRPAVAVLASVESVDFKQAMKLGNTVELHAQVRNGSCVQRFDSESFDIGYRIR